MWVQTITRSYCRAEQRERRFRFAGYATAHAQENTIRPRAFYQSCGTCALQILTLGGHRDVPDALGLCRAVFDEWLRRRVRARATATESPFVSAAARFDAEGVLGDLYAHIWHLYNRWNPAFGAGSGTFRGYASSILAKKINTFVARDTGDAAGSRTFPKAHSRTVSTSWEGLVEAATESGQAASGLELALGSVAHDDTAGDSEARFWLDVAADRGARGVAAGHGRPADV